MALGALKGTKPLTLGSFDPVHEIIYLLKRRLEWASHVSLRMVGQVGTRDTWKRVDVSPAWGPRKGQDASRGESERVTGNIRDGTIS